MSNFMNTDTGAAENHGKPNATSKKKRADDGLTPAERRKKRIAAAEARLQALIAKDKEADAKEAHKLFVPLGKAMFTYMQKMSKHDREQTLSVLAQHASNNGAIAVERLREHFNKSEQ